MTADSETTHGKTSGPGGAGGTGSGESPEDRGKTWIADEVISVIARITAEQVDGVHQLGESSLRSMLPRSSRHWGVASEVGLKEAAIDVEVVVEFGYPIWQVADTMRREVIDTIEHMTGRRVVEVNISVVDVHVPKVEHHPRRRVQ
ncbi:MAG: Asp23/Gls24 family envelope stress response protein [Myxococcota bacterium]